MRKKALLAVIFAGGILNSQMPTIGKKSSESTDSVTDQMVSSSHAEPEVRAYYLLGVARSYLSGATKSVVEAQLCNVISQGGSNYFKVRNESILIAWANQVALEEHPDNNEIKQGAAPSTCSKQVMNGESKALANTATKEALAQLEKSSGEFAKLHMYFIASRYFRRLGNASDALKCDKLLDEAFRACEGAAPVSEERVKAAASILNSMAYGFVPIEIPDRDPKANRLLQSAKKQKEIAEEDFGRAEKLKLRALTMTDRLATMTDLRRRAHRDLAIWYMQLGKILLAEKEKLILFSLVGTLDDSILYPQSGVCGHLIWWQTKKVDSSGMDCGMG